MGLILVLDDELDACRLMQRVLTLRGHEVHAFTDHEEAARWVEAHEPDLALVDIKLKGTDGIDFLRRLRLARSGTKVIMITGYPSRETADEAQTMGVEDYLVKPLEIDELEDRVKRALENFR